MTGPATVNSNDTMALTGPSLVIEQQIIHGLLTDDAFLRKAIPHLKDDYFTDEGARVVFKAIRNHITEYNAPPSREALIIALDSTSGLRQQTINQAMSVIETVTSTAFAPSNRDWLVKTAEKYAQDRALYNALLECVSIIDDNKKSKKSKGTIPSILTDALAVSFDTNVGHDYINAAEDRYRYYHRVEERVPFDIDILNEITKGGLPKKTLTVIQAGCVSPDAVVDLLIDGREFLDVPFATIECALAAGMEVRIASPAGWSLVKAFHHKGTYVGYDVRCVSSGELVVVVNEDHLFAIDGRWVRAADLITFECVPLMSVNGTHDCVVSRSDRTVHIVDITVGADSIPYAADSESVMTSNVSGKTLDDPHQLGSPCVHQYYVGRGKNKLLSHNTNVGKSLFMCHMAAACLKQGLNVLYITLEMAEEGIAERIDSNLLDVSTDDLHAMPRDMFIKKVDKLKMQNPGRLIIKEYPTTAAGALHFRHLISELKLKKKFEPDIVFVDYLNLCQSARLPASAAQNSYGYVKSIAEELRGLAGEFNLPLVTATQTNRAGFANSDFGLEDTSESFGVPMTADFTLGVVSTEELERMGLYQCKVLKLRFGSKRHKRRFVIGVDYDRMRLYNVDDAEQNAVANEPEESDDVPRFRGRKRTAKKVSANGFKF